MTAKEETAGWLKACVVWIDEKFGADGPMKEVIYELQDDPDLLRQVTVPASALYAEAKRGDKILVQPGDRLIMKDAHES
jgi:hypothetical protein